jgi:hypothetical protein
VEEEEGEVVPVAVRITDRIGAAARCRWTSAPRRTTPRPSATSAGTVRTCAPLFRCSPYCNPSVANLRPPISVSGFFAGILKDLLKPDKDKENKSSWKVSAILSSII